MKTLTIVLLVFFIGIPVLFFTAFRFLVGRFGYVNRGNEVVYRTFDMGNGGLVEKKLIGADCATFKRLSPGYAKDKAQVYFKSHVLQGCSPSSFKIIDHTWKFSRDDKSVYYCGRLISDDPEGFEALDHGYARDSKVAYRYSKVLLDSHGPTFQLIHGSKVYTKDRQNVYSLDKLLEGAHAPSFELLGYVFTKDKDHVYFSGLIIDGADPQTFKFLGQHYGIDKNKVYWNRHVIPGADATTFKIEKKGGKYHASDQYHTYSWGKRVEPDK